MDFYIVQYRIAPNREQACLSRKAASGYRAVLKESSIKAAFLEPAIQQ